MFNMLNPKNKVEVAVLATGAALGTAAAVSLYPYVRDNMGYDACPCVEGNVEQVELEDVNDVYADDPQ